MKKHAGTWAAPQQVGEASALIGILNLLPEQVNLQSFEDALWNLIGDDEFYDKVDKLKKEAPTASKDILINYVKETLTKWLSNLVKENQWWKEKWDPKAIAMLKDFIQDNPTNPERYDNIDMENTSSNGSTMLIKVASLGEDLYKVSDNDIPIDKPELEAIVKNSSLLFADEEKFWANLLKNKEAELKLTADTGTVVDMYEVDYPAGASDNDIIMAMDPEKDLITETVMPGIPVKNVNINVGASKKNWREVLGQLKVEKRTYEFSGEPKQLDEIEKALSFLSWCNGAGASRTIKINTDGDGSANIFEKQLLPLFKRYKRSIIKDAKENTNGT